MDMSAPSLTEQLLHSLPVAMVFTDRDGIVFEASDRVRAQLGWDLDDLRGRSILDLFPDELHRDLRTMQQRWVTDGTSPFDGRVIRLPVRGADGDTHELGVRVHLADTGFALALLDVRATGDGLRARLLDALSDPAITGSALTDVLGEIGEAFDWDLATMWTVDTHATALRAAAVWERGPGTGDGYRAATLGQPQERNHGLAGTAWERGTPALVDDVSSDARFSDEGTIRPRSGATIPLKAGRRVVGVLEVLALHDVDATLWLASESDALSTGLGQLVERFRDRVQVDVVEGRLALALDAGELGVWSLDARSGVARWSVRMAELHAVSGVEGGAEDVFAAVSAADRPAVGQALERARERDDSQTVEYRVHDAERGTSWLSTRVTRVQENGGPPILAAVSSDITDRKRAELSLQRRRAAVESLQWVSQAIIAGRRLDDTAIAVAHAATGVLGAELGVVLYPRPGEVGSDLAWAISGLPGDEPVPPPPSSSSVDLGSVAATATGVQVVRDLRRNERVRAFVASLGLPVDVGRLRSALVVPVGGDRGRPLGAMLFAHSDRGFFTEDDARLAASIGSTTGVAIENARRHEEQRLAAVTFQRQMLPGPVESVPGAELCVRYHPGRDGMDVGGDWYDVIDLDEHRIGLAVGDVCGHGLTAAAHMGQFRFSFRALLQSSSTPLDAFRVLNRIALRELDTTVTIAYAELDVRTGSCTAWVCGHLPPVISSPGGTSVRWLDDDAARGPMLGFLDDIDVGPIRTTLAPGELLLLYTDGLVERRGESITTGLDRLAGALQGRSRELGDLCDELYQVLAAAGQDADDTVLLGARRH